MNEYRIIEWIQSYWMNIELLNKNQKIEQDKNWTRLILILNVNENLSNKTKVAETLLN